MKLHLGCGKRYIPGFVHVDIADYPHIDYHQDIRRLSKFKDETADLIYACHVLEYFDRAEVGEVLKEWYRVLKGDGILRLAVPDFAALVHVYNIYGQLSKIIGPLYGRIPIEGNKENKFIYHRTVYDFNDLKSVLDSIGFREVRRYDWRKTIHRDYDDFSQAYVPHMDKENGILISLNVEAVK